MQIEVRFEIPEHATELKIVVSNAGDGNWCDAAVIGDAKLINALEIRQKGGCQQ